MITVTLYFVFFFKSMVSEEETSNRFYNNNSPNIHLFVKTPKQVAFKFYFRKENLKTDFLF